MPTRSKISTRQPTILLVSDDAELCAAARQELAARTRTARVAAVSNIDAARRIVQDARPDVIVLEEAAVPIETEGPRGRVPQFDVAVTSLAVYAPVVVIGTEEAECQPGLSALVAAGAADYVKRSGGCMPLAMEHVERRLKHAKSVAASAPERFEEMQEDFGEVLRHELNNPLTGILGNAELLLAEIRRRSDGRLPQGGQQRVETIAALAVRLRETVRRLSYEWESHHHAATR